MAYNQSPKRTRGRKWMKLRNQALDKDNRLCVACKAKGRTEPAREVDHIIPLHKGGTDDLDNLEGLCIPCHEAKTAKDMGYTVKQTFGPDGWPVGGV